MLLLLIMIRIVCSTPLKILKPTKQKNIHVAEGDANSLSGMKFDIILANINRNILLRDIEQYVKAMKQDALLLVSGF